MDKTIRISFELTGDEADIAILKKDLEREGLKGICNGGSQDAIEGMLESIARNAEFNDVGSLPSACDRIYRKSRYSLQFEIVDI